MPTRHRHQIDGESMAGGRDQPVEGAQTRFPTIGLVRADDGLGTARRPSSAWDRRARVRASLIIAPDVDSIGV